MRKYRVIAKDNIYKTSKKSFHIVYIMYSFISGSQSQLRGIYVVWKITRIAFCKYAVFLYHWSIYFLIDLYDVFCV